MAGSTTPISADLLRALCGEAPLLRHCAETEERRTASSGRSISPGWRKNTSAIEAVELANLLRALRKVAGHLGPNVGRIEYAGMSRGPEHAIVIEPRWILGRYPVPADRVDYLVGWVAHEALHRIEWSERVWRLLDPAFQEMAGLERVAFQKLVHAGEDIYVGQVTDRGVFGFYTPQVRAGWIEEAWRKLRPDVLSVDALVCHWWASTWRLESCPGPDPAYGEPLARLGRLARELEGVGRMSRGVTVRSGRRADLYLEAWQDLREGLSCWEITDKKLHWYPGKTEPARPQPEGLAGQRTPEAGLPASLAREVEIELARHSTDLTPIIRQIVGAEDDSVAPTSRWDFQIPAHPLVDRAVVSRLRMIFQSYSAGKTVKSRGLVSGKLDRRRLHRAPVTGCCFEFVDRIPDPEWNVTLLIDASGSMRGAKWRMVESAVANLHRALLGSRNHLEAHAYYEMDGVCMVSRLIKGRQLLSVPPNGRTASGQAIIAAAYFMPKGRRRNLLVHVTDGESNFGCDVRHGIEYCREQRIHLVTLACGYQKREALLVQYGRTLQFLNSFGQLASAVERLLKWTFLYGARPHLHGHPVPLADGSPLRPVTANRGPAQAAAEGFPLRTAVRRTPDAGGTE